MLHQAFELAPERLQAGLFDIGCAAAKGRNLFVLMA